MLWVVCQNAEGFRKRALEGVKVVTYLQEFANVAQLSELSELFQDDNRLAEAAVRALGRSTHLNAYLSCGRSMFRIMALPTPARCWKAGPPM